MKNKYSKNEIKLFESLNYGDLLEHIDPLGLYQMAAETAFINNTTGSNIEALRCAMMVFKNCSMYRHTDEFERLIEFDD